MRTVKKKASVIRLKYTPSAGWLDINFGGEIFRLLKGEVMLDKYKQQNRGYKSDKKWKSTETLINKGLEAKKHQNRDKTKCTKGYIYMQKMSRNNAPNCTRIGRIYLLHG